MILKTYCAYPFVSSSLQADNTVLPCGQFMKSSLFKNIIPIHEVRNGPVMNEMRRKMLNGELVDGCQCFVEEASGFSSMRQAGIEKFGFTTETKLKRLELVFDNVCNIKCRSCASVNSHLWYEDEIALYGQSLLGKKYLKNTLYKDINLKDLEEIEVLGGEPMISPGTNNFFNILQANNKFADLTIMLSTNGMARPEGSILEGLLQCQNLKLNISIDAFGNYNDYVRSGSNWNTICQNLNFYKDLIQHRKDKNTRISVHTAVSIYNINQLDLLENFIKSNYREFQTSKQIVQFPVYLSIKNTPQSFKDAVRPYVKSEEIISYLDSPGNDYFSHFINFTRQLDKIRNESMDNAFLKNYIENYEYKVEEKESFIFFNEELKKIKD